MPNQQWNRDTLVYSEEPKVNMDIVFSTHETAGQVQNFREHYNNMGIIF
jgi:hypothetical protein